MTPRSLPTIDIPRITACRVLRWHCTPHGLHCSPATLFPANGGKWLTSSLHVTFGHLGTGVGLGRLVSPKIPLDRAPLVLAYKPKAVEPIGERDIRVFSPFQFPPVSPCPGWFSFSSKMNYNPRASLSGSSNIHTPEMMMIIMPGTGLKASHVPSHLIAPTLGDTYYWYPQLYMRMRN